MNWTRLEMLTPIANNGKIVRELWFFHPTVSAILSATLWRTLLSWSQTPKSNRNLSARVFVMWLMILLTSAAATTIYSSTAISISTFTCGFANHQMVPALNSRWKKFTQPKNLNYRVIASNTQDPCCHLMRHLIQSPTLNWLKRCLLKSSTRLRTTLSPSHSSITSFHSTTLMERFTLDATKSVIRKSLCLRKLMMLRSWCSSKLDQGWPSNPSRYSRSLLVARLYGKIQSLSLPLRSEERRWVVS